MQRKNKDQVGTKDQSYALEVRKTMLWKIGFCDGSSAGRTEEDDIWITDEKDEVIIGSGGGCCATPSIRSTEEQTAFEIARQIVEDHNRKEVIERFNKRMENIEN